ncbi:site-specific integrase [Streptomyces sp. FB2]|uniref:tyrosine-type recombinase/integrase n=1 Tax=Streptomyces sp. FB2 TaxID=2902454 RepID=UPI001F4779BC|nr:site-specific integrase [Streptomyces sp. FB2]MCF2538961.1 site-specific integrase [Streptomyces sp. FB2]
MAGHIQDRWYKTETGSDGKPRKVKTDRYGVGLRYRARYIGPDGTEKSKSFPDRRKREAEQWLGYLEADMARGAYISPRAGRVTFQQYAEEWMKSQDADPSTRESVESRLRLHAFPHIGQRPMASFTPSHLRSWLRALEETGLAAAYRRVIFAHVSTVFTAAVEDRIIHENPCRSRSVKAPRLDPRKVAPWSYGQVRAVRHALDDRYRVLVDLAAGCGLRQGEAFGLGVEDIDFESSTLHVVRQVKLLQGRPVFAPPKGGKPRYVPLPGSVAASVSAHLTTYPVSEAQLPWRTLDGPTLSVPLICRTSADKAIGRNTFNAGYWRPALLAAGVEPGPGNGMHALRHFYASVLLDAGESIKALSEYLGHADPAFTLRTYTHLMPSSDSRTRFAVDALFGEPSHSDGPPAAPTGRTMP